MGERKYRQELWPKDVQVYYRGPFYSCTEHALSLDYTQARYVWEILVSADIVQKSPVGSFLPHWANG